MEKDKFKERLKKSIDKLFESIDELDSRKGEFSEKAKEKYHEVMAEIKQVETNIEAWHQRMQRNNDPEWEETRNSFKNSANSFKVAFENLINYLKKSPSSSNKDDDDPDYVI